MRLCIVLVLLLSSCTASFSEQQALLNRYAQTVESEGELSEVLTQSALVQAQASRDLIKELGYTQRGRARFEIWSASNSYVSGCLDLRQVQVIDSKGAFLSLGQKRSVFSASITRGNLISSFEISKEKC